MAVLKSFDLKGNKQSFAGWISNLSPCDTPFVSMIGKEGTSQTQYSWQMDALDVPKHTGYEEGSLVGFEERHPTHVNHNFTSILRKVATVSDTAATVALYGRDSEMAYQMSKAGKELKRDMEFMCLNNGEGNIGTSTMASKFSGFMHLCAPKGYVDFGTGAETYKTVEVADISGPWFNSADLFDLTYNLYLAGSKANKIMFHPRHAFTFSNFIGGNPDSPLTYRMFDAMDDKFNAKVTKIRDPLGQFYDLIPNRYMPEDKIYIFNEADWTQMILRQPVVSPLSKQGSSSRFLLEAEVGLRHRHVNASGVMDMLPSKLLMTWTKKPERMTAGSKETDVAELVIKDRETNIPLVVGTKVTWSSSNELVVTVARKDDTTLDGGIASNTLTPIRAGSAIITVTCEDSVSTFRVTVVNPSIRLTMSSPIAEVGKTPLAVVYVTNHEGKPVKDGTVVHYSANPSTLVGLESISSETKDGTAEITVTTRGLGLVELRARVGDANSNYASLNIVEKVEVLVMEITQRVLALGVNDSVLLSLEVLDGDGSPIPNQTIGLASTNPSVVTLASSSINTGAGGTSTLRITANGLGRTEILGTFKDQTFPIEVVVADPIITLVAPSNATVGEVLTMTATVVRGDQTALGAGIDVDFEAVPAFDMPVATVSTNAQGVATATYTLTSNSDLSITAITGSASSNTVNVSVGDADTSADRYYSHTITGHTVKGTHSTGIAVEPVINTYHVGEPARGIRMVCESLTPEIAVVSDYNVPIDFSGNYTVKVHGLKSGTARIRVKARDNVGGWFEFSVEFGAPTVNVVIQPTTLPAGQPIE
ncbi:MAG: SU10 major capsid protein, partial [Bacteroidales bacterium]